jgi:hypothetical protein
MEDQTRGSGPAAPGPFDHPKLELRGVEIDAAPGFDDSGPEAAAEGDALPPLADEPPPEETVAEQLSRQRQGG